MVGQMNQILVIKGCHLKKYHFNIKLIALDVATPT